MVTVWDMGDIAVQSRCAACGEHMAFDDRCIILIKAPSMQTEMLCLECHLCIIASATAYLRGDGADLQNTVKSRLQAALAIHEKIRDYRASHRARV